MRYRYVAQGESPFWQSLIPIYKIQLKQFCTQKLEAQGRDSVRSQWSITKGQKN